MISVMHGTAELHKAEPSGSPAAQSALQRCVCQPHSVVAQLHRQALEQHKGLETLHGTVAWHSASAGSDGLLEGKFKLDSLK